MVESMIALSNPTRQLCKQRDEDQFVNDWFSQLLKQMEYHLTSETNLTLLKGCASAHYRMLNMDHLLSAYRGNLPGFLKFLTENRQWKLDFNHETQVITADENKANCVCPLVQKKDCSRCISSVLLL